MSLTEFEQLLQRYYEGTCTEKEKEWVDRWLKNTNLNREDTWAHFTDEERKTHVDNLYDRISGTIQDATPGQTTSATQKNMATTVGCCGSECVAVFFGLCYFAAFKFRCVARGSRSMDCF